MKDAARESGLKLGTRFFTAYRLSFLAVLVLSILVYLPSLEGEKVWDDKALLDGSGVGGRANPQGVLIEAFLGAYFRPIVSASFQLENEIWNGNPFFYHQTNILIHAATAAALVGLLMLAFGSRRIAILGGLLFAVQPAQVSTVAWIGGRTDSLCTLLVALFAYTLLLGIRAHGRAAVLWIGLSALAFLGALMTKEQVLALLLLVPLALTAFGPSRGTRGAHIRLLAPYALAAVLFLALWLAFYPNPFKPLIRGPIEQLATAGHSATFYSLLLLAPAAKWMHTLSLGSLERVGLLSILPGLILLSGFIWIAIKSQRGDPKLGWLIALIALTILPVVNLIPLPSLLVAPYRAGLAGLGVAAVLAVLAVRFYSRAPRLATIGLGAYVVWCGALSGWGAAQWSGPTQIFSTIIRHDPDSIVTRRNLSGELIRAGRPTEAAATIEGILGSLYGDGRWRDHDQAVDAYLNDEELQRRVVENQGNLVKPGDWLGELYSQLAYARAQAHDFEGSRAALRTGMSIDRYNPNIRVALAQFAIFDKDTATAYRHLSVASGAWEKSATLKAMLADSYFAAGKLRSAQATYEAAVELEPWFAPHLLGLADVQMERGDLVGARQTIAKAEYCDVVDRDGASQRLARLDSLEKTRSEGHDKGKSARLPQVRPAV